jgi:monoamine oxidase
LLVLVGGDVGGIAAAASLRKLGVPVLHLAEELPPEAAVEYARSVEAAWISYPATGGVKIATADATAEFVFMSPQSVARTVLP